MQYYFETVRRTFTLSATALLLLLSGIYNPASADELCTRSVNSASAIDGIVAPGLSAGACVADTLWPAIGPAEFQPGGSSPVAYLRIARITSTSRLRIGIDVAGDDDVSNFDAVLLFFDANNNGSWDNQDFAVRIFTSPSDDVINSGEACSLTTGTVEYFQYNSVESTWDSNAAAAGQITARYAYDYTAPDPEDDVWNLEFDFPINVAGAFQLNTAGSYFAVGGYLFVDDGHLQSPQLGSVRSWPSAVVSELTGVLPDISFSFSPLQVTAPVASVLANINLESVCFDVNFSEHSWQINGIESESGDNHLNRNGNNRFRVGYYFDGPGDAPQPISNPGTVRMSLTPYRTGGVTAPWVTDIDVNSDIYNYNQLHMTDEKVLNFPGEFDTTADLNFVCAKLDLVDFQLDDSTSNNSSSINHNYFVTSSYRQTVELSSAGIPNLQAGQSAKIWMKVDNNNEHPDVQNFIQTQYAQSQNGSGSSASLCSGWLLILIVALLVLVVLIWLILNKKSAWKKPLWAALVLLLLLLAYLLYQNCSSDSGSGASISTPRWTIANAGELGIKPVAKKPGWYEVPIAYGETKQLQLRFQGQPLPYKPQRMRLQAAENGEPGRLDIPVRPGQVLTVIATGEVDLDGKDGPLAPTMAGGFTETPVVVETDNADGSVEGKNAAVLKKLYADNVPYMHVAADLAQPSGLVMGNVEPVDVNADVMQPTASVAQPSAAMPTMLAPQNYPLASGYYQPHQFAGALAGWFHGDKASSGTFVLGRATSVVVPEGVTTLSVFVNAQWQAYATLAGFYDLVVVTTPAPTVPTRTVPGGDATYRLPIQLPPWLALTSINMYTYFPDIHIEQGAVISTTLLPLGDAHFTVYDTHVDSFDANFNQVLIR
jgi:hypothetical protein